MYILPECIVGIIHNLLKKHGKKTFNAMKFQQMGENNLRAMEHTGEMHICHFFCNNQLGFYCSLALNFCGVIPLRKYSIEYYIKIFYGISKEIFKGILELILWDILCNTLYGIFYNTFN